MIQSSNTFAKTYSKFNKELRKINERDETNLRSTPNKYGFIVDTTKIIELTRGEKSTYTIRVYRKEATPGMFENVVIRTDSLNQLEAYLLKYYHEGETFGEISYEHSVEIEKINYSDLLREGELICSEVTEWYCTYQDNNQSNPCGGSPHPAGLGCWNKANENTQCTYPVNGGPDCIFVPGGSFPSDGYNGDDNLHPEGGGVDTTPIPDPDPDEEDIHNGDQIANELNTELAYDPYLLLDIDCNQIQNWQTLAQHSPPQGVLDKIENLPSSFFNSFEIQPLDEANGSIINMDYFPINVSSLPNKPNGDQYTADEFLDYMRRNINPLTEGGGTTFSPFCQISSMCTQETNLWESNNPLGAIIYLDIPSDDGVVVCSKFQNDHWYFSTMNASYAGNHPVSGTRQFGYINNPDGSYTFYTRGVDRFNSFIQSDVAQALLGTDTFLAADLMWYSLQNNTRDFINSNGGTSIAGQVVKNRVNWSKVKDVLLGIKPISDLGCN